MAERFASVTGSVVIPSEHKIVGRDGEHLQFVVDVPTAGSWQVDANIQSSDGTPMEVCIRSETLGPQNANPDTPPDLPAEGVFDASLSYAGLGLQDSMFSPIADTAILSQLESALRGSTRVTVYGLLFHDSGSNTNGIHETHFDPSGRNQDGAVVVYGPATGNTLLRTSFFFKFEGDHIATSNANSGGQAA